MAAGTLCTSGRSGFAEPALHLARQGDRLRRVAFASFPGGRPPTRGWGRRCWASAPPGPRRSCGRSRRRDSVRCASPAMNRCATSCTGPSGGRCGAARSRSRRRLSDRGQCCERRRAPRHPGGWRSGPRPRFRKGLALPLQLRAQRAHGLVVVDPRRIADDHVYLVPGEGDGPHEVAGVVGPKYGRSPRRAAAAWRRWCFGGSAARRGW